MLVNPLSVIADVKLQCSAILKWNSSRLCFNLYTATFSEKPWKALLDVDLDPSFIFQLICFVLYASIMPFKAQYLFCTNMFAFIYPSRIFLYIDHDDMC